MATRKKSRRLQRLSTLRMEKAAAHLVELLVSRDRTPAGALVTFAFAKSGTKSWTFVTCRWEFSDEPREARPSRDYGDLFLGETWFDIEDAFSNLVLFILGFPDGAQIPSLHESWRLARTGDNVTGWSEWRFEGRLADRNQRVPVPHLPVVQFDLPPFPSGQRAVHDWVFPMLYFSGGDPSWYSEIHILIPDTRARIRAVDWTTRGLEVDLDLNASVEDVQVQFVPTGDTSVDVGFYVAGEKVRWNPPEQITRGTLYLVHRDKTLLGQMEVARGEVVDATTLVATSLATAEADLRSGEGDRVEFKPFIAPNDTKEAEVVKAIVAFANSGGGRIYLGVTDDGVPQGTPGLRRAAGEAPTIALKTLLDRVQRVAREKIKPVPVIEPEILEVFGESIIVCRVLDGEEKPYATHEHDVFVRKGATNRKPDPKTELPALLQAGGVV